MRKQDYEIPEWEVRRYEKHGIARAIPIEEQDREYATFMDYRDPTVVINLQTLNPRPTHAWINGNYPTQNVVLGNNRKKVEVSKRAVELEPDLVGIVLIPNRNGISIRSVG